MSSICTTWLDCKKTKDTKHRNHTNLEANTAKRCSAIAIPLNCMNNIISLYINIAHMHIFHDYIRKYIDMSVIHVRVGYIHLYLCACKILYRRMWDFISRLCWTPGSHFAIVMHDSLHEVTGFLLYWPATLLYVGKCARNFLWANSYAFP